MVTDSFSSDLATIRELGSRLEAVRLRKNLTQREIAEKAGVSEASVRRLESGEVATRLSTFVAICRALDLADRFETLLPQRTIQPIEALKLQGRRRLRARRSKPKPTTPWTWGEPE
jgi:transcriptional regulator with XRE-family HTH domain